MSSVRHCVCLQSWSRLYSRHSCAFLCTSRGPCRCTRSTALNAVPRNRKWKQTIVTSFSSRFSDKNPTNASRRMFSYDRKETTGGETDGQTYGWRLIAAKRLDTNITGAVQYWIIIAFYKIIFINSCTLLADVDGAAALWRVVAATTFCHVCWRLT